MRHPSLALALLTLCAVPAAAQDTVTWTRADTLRGSFDTPGRSWWDVTFYDLHVTIDPAERPAKARSMPSWSILPVRSFRNSIGLIFPWDSSRRELSAVRRKFATVTPGTHTAAMGTTIP